MNGPLQQCLVFVIVAAAMAYATLKFMPAGWRRSLASSVASFAARAGLSETHARRVEKKLSTGGACGSCDSCKACATSGEKSDEAPGASSPARFIPIRRA